MAVRGFEGACQLLSIQGASPVGVRQELNLLSIKSLTSTEKQVNLHRWYAFNIAGERSSAWLQGNIRGPFTAGAMHHWFMKSLLPDGLLVCGMASALPLLPCTSRLIALDKKAAAHTKSGRAIL